MRLSDLTEEQWAELRADLISKLPEYAGRPKRRIDTYGTDCYIQLSGGILEMGYDIVRHKLLIWACSSRASGVDAPVDDLSTIQSIIMDWCKQWHIGTEDLV